jgi:rhamnosyltransferase
MQPKVIDKGNLPKVAVCLAAYNGVKYLYQQIESILSQIGVDLTLYISVDKSSDGTELLVDQFAKMDHRVITLPHNKVFGGAGKNFFRLICEVDFNHFDFVSFADQDDVWMLDKLKNHIILANTNCADGISSNVQAFWPNGRQKLIDKTHAQTNLDFLFESAGPGCTFLMTVPLVKKVRERLLDKKSFASKVELHDWLIYAVCRADGRKWIVDKLPSVKYRQHTTNVIGANVGFFALLVRFKKLKQGWYRSEVLKILSTCLEVRQNAKMVRLRELLITKNYFSSLRLLAYIALSRRRLRDRCLLGMCILFGFF